MDSKSGEIFKSDESDAPVVSFKNGNKGGATGQVFEVGDKFIPLKSENPDPVITGHKEAIKDTIKDSDTSKEKFEQLVEKSIVPLYTISTIFPFQFFPKHVMVDLNKVSIVNNLFFFSKRRHSIFIEDVTDVYTDTNLFFATLSIVDRGFIENEIKIPYLHKSEAIKMRRIIQGLLVAHRQKVDLSKLEGTPQIVVKLEALGESHSPDT
jgi:hypothetical protein